MHKKILISLFFATSPLIACSGPIDQEPDIYDPNRQDVKDAQVEFSFVSAALIDADDDAFAESKLEFVLYLSRPDLNMKQPLQERDKASIYTVDLPLALQPRLMYVSEVNDADRDTGNMCYRQIFPHTCTVTLKPEDFKKEKLTYLIKILFEDETYASKEITVPVPARLAAPALVEPAATPEQGSSLTMRFKDVGADDYEIAVNLCREYGDDGINPCLDGVNYQLKRKDGVLADVTYQTLYPIKIVQEDGMIILTSDFPISFEESVEYSIIARKFEEMGGRVPATTTSYELKNFVDE